VIGGDAVTVIIGVNAVGGAVAVGINVAFYTVWNSVCVTVAI
jgi:pyruvate/2-oxoacid:ferredoxin oxidoreductase beta subunit